MTKKIRAEQHLAQISMRSSDALERTVAVIDDIFDHLGLGHPAQNVVSLLKDLSPKSILGDKLNIPPPGELVDTVFAQLREKFHEGDIIEGTGLGYWRRKILGRG